MYSFQLIIKYSYCYYPVNMNEKNTRLLICIHMFGFLQPWMMSRHEEWGLIPLF